VLKNQKWRGEIKPDQKINNLKKYISEQKKLTYEQQLWIFRKDPKSRTEKDILDIINSNLALVFSIANSFLKKHKDLSNNFLKNNDVNLMDLFNAGIIGLNVAIKKYDAWKGTKFSTYSYNWIAVYIRDEIKKTIYPLKTYSHTKVNVFSLDGTDRFQKEDETENSYDNIYYRDLIALIQNELSVSDFNIFHKYFIRNMTMKMISIEVGKSIYAIQYALERIKKILREYLIQVEGVQL